MSLFGVKNSSKDDLITTSEEQERMCLKAFCLAMISLSRDISDMRSCPKYLLTLLRYLFYHKRVEFKIDICSGFPTSAFNAEQTFSAFLYLLFTKITSDDIFRYILQYIEIQPLNILPHNILRRHHLFEKIAEDVTELYPADLVEIDALFSNSKFSNTIDSKHLIFKNNKIKLSPEGKGKYLKVGDGGYTYLHHFALTGNYKDLAILLEYVNADRRIDAEFGDYLGELACEGFTALHFAAGNGHKQCVKYLLKHSLNPRTDISRKEGGVLAIPLACQKYIDYYYTSGAKSIELAMRGGHWSVLDICLQSLIDETDLHNSKGIQRLKYDILSTSALNTVKIMNKSFTIHHTFMNNPLLYGRLNCLLVLLARFSFISKEFYEQFTSFKDDKSRELMKIIVDSIMSKDSNNRSVVLEALKNHIQKMRRKGHQIGFFGNLATELESCAREFFKRYATLNI